MIYYFRDCLVFLSLLFSQKPLNEVMLKRFLWGSYSVKEVSTTVFNYQEQLRKFYRVFNVAPAPIIKILNHGPRVLPIPTDIPTYNGYSIHGRLRTLQSKHLQCSKPLKNGDVSNLVSREFLLVILSIFKESHRKLSFRWNICDIFKWLKIALIFSFGPYSILYLWLKSSLLFF